MNAQAQANLNELNSQISAVGGQIRDKTDELRKLEDQLNELNSERATLLETAGKAGTDTVTDHTNKKTDASLGTSAR